MARDTISAIIRNIANMVIDFHTHILPQLDDGSASTKESIALLQLEAEQGIETVVVTPHFYAHNDNPERFLRHRRDAYHRLQEKIADREDLPKIHLGAEVYYFAGMSNSDSLQRMTIGDGKYMLLEMPFARWSDTMYREIEAIYTKQGITPIIAHVDRYITPLSAHGIPERLMDLPVLVQANANFFLKATTRRMALRMLRRGQIHLLGSDCHNLTSRKPNLGEACRIITNNLGEECTSAIKEYQMQVFRRGCEQHK